MAEITEDKDKVRLLISDVGGNDGNSFVFSDDEINGFLSMETDVYSAAAQALRTLAANEALVSKRIQFLELKTDGPAVAKELRELAKELDVKSEDAGEGDDDWDPVVEMVTEHFGYRASRRRSIL